MKTLEDRVQNRIEDYVASRMNEQEKEDFECDMDVDIELQKDVARVYLRKLHLERKVKQHIEKMNQGQFMDTQLVLIQNKFNQKCQAATWWSKMKSRFSLN